jgi:flagella basal body P-ring formation protein FlgA
MTNSFIPAPDFSSVLGQSFQGLNESLSRQEEMERENDKRRELNASMPLKMFEALADFSATAAKAVKAQRDATIAKVDSKANTFEENADIEKKIEILERDAAVQNKIKGKAKLNKDFEVVKFVNESSSLNFKKQAEILKYVGHVKLPALLNEKYRPLINAAKDEDEVASLFGELTTELKAPYLEKFNKRLLSYYLDKNINSYRDTALAAKTQQVGEKLDAEDVNLLNQSAFNSLTDNTYKDRKKWIETNHGLFPNGKGGAYDFYIEFGTALAEANRLPTDNVRSIWEDTVTPKGEKPIKYKDKFPLKYAESMLKLEEIDRDKIDRDEEEIRAGRLKMEQDFRKVAAEAEDRKEPLTDEYIEGLKTAWVEQGFGTREDASFLDDYSTQQERDYDKDKKYIQALVAARKSYGGHLYDSDFDGMGNRIKSEYASQVQLSRSTLTPPSGILDAGNGEVEGAVNDRHKGAFGTINRGRTYKREMRIGKEKFLEYYAEAIGKGNVSASGARDIAIGKVVADLDKNLYTQPPVVELDIQKQIDLKDARQSILDDPNIINTGVPDGLQNYIPDLVRIQKAGRGEIPEIFGLVAANTPYSKWQFANKILENATGSGFIIPAAELDVENLPTYQQELLNKYSSSSRTSRVIADQPEVTNMFLDPKTAIYDEDFYAFETMDGTLSNFGSFTIGDIFNSDNVQKVGAHLIPIEDLYAVFEMTGLSMDDQFGPEEQQKFVKTIANAKANSNNILNGLNTEWTGLSVVPDELFEGIPEIYKDKFDMSTILPDVLNDFPLLR